MSENDKLIKREILTWLSENEWLNEAPSHDFSIEYFSNFFSQKFEGLTRLHLEKLLRELKDSGLVELKLYFNNRVEIIRGLTRDGVVWVNLSKNT